jgi:hypothetical protein
MDTAMETPARHEAGIERLMEAETARARDALSGGPTAKHAEDRPGDRFDEGCEATNPIENAASPGRRRHAPRRIAGARLDRLEAHLFFLSRRPYRPSAASRHHAQPRRLRSMTMSAPHHALAPWILGAAPAFLWMPWLLAIPSVLPWGQTTAAALQGVGLVLAGLLAMRRPRGAWTRIPWAVLAATMVLLTPFSTPVGLAAGTVSGIAMGRILLESFEAFPHVRHLGMISVAFNVANLAIPGTTALALAAMPEEAVPAAAALLAAACHRLVLPQPPAGAAQADLPAWPRRLPAVGLVVTTIAIGLGPAGHVLALPAPVAAVGMTLMQAGMLAGALLSTWRPIPPPACLAIAASGFGASLFFASGWMTAGLVVGLAFAATFPSLMRAALPENSPSAQGALLAGRYIAITLGSALGAAIGAAAV